MQESEKWKWSRSAVSDSSRPHGLQPTRLLHPWDFPGKRAEWGAIAFSEYDVRITQKHCFLSGLGWCGFLRHACCYCCCLVAQLCPTLLWPHGLQPARLLCPWNFPSKNTRVDCHFLLQGIFLTQGLNLCLLHFWQILYYWATWEALDMPSQGKRNLNDSSQLWIQYKIWG